MRMTDDRQAMPEYDESRLFERPDGFYWQSRDSAHEYGPFPSLLEALTDLEANEAPEADEEALEVAETLAEAEAEVGISGWIDPDSGELAEEERPRIEEH